MLNLSNIGSSTTSVTTLEAPTPSQHLAPEAKLGGREIVRIQQAEVKFTSIGESNQNALFLDLKKAYGISGPETVKKMTEALKARSLSIAYNNTTKKFTVIGSSEVDEETIKKIFAENRYHGWEPHVLSEVDSLGNRLVQLRCIVEPLFESNIIPSRGFMPRFLHSLPASSSTSLTSSVQLNGNEIAEILQSEAGFTIATDKKPIVATYGCGPCVALGGYDPTNKIAFVVHFSHAGEVRKCGGLVFSNILKLTKEKIEAPIQLHLRGGVKNVSESTVEAIKIWMKQREDLPMVIASENILLSGIGRGKSLSIDSRTGEVSEYDPTANPKSRGMSDSDAMTAIMSAYLPNIKLAYTPKE